MIPVHRWTRQVVSHAPAVAAGFAVFLADSIPLALAWSLASRLAYVLFVGVSLRAEDTRRALSRDLGPEAAYERFSRRAGWLMDNDAIALAALCLVSAGTLATPESWIASGVLGGALFLVGAGVKIWAAASLDSGSWHWRNFFVPAEEHGPPRGPYRVLANPMYTVGYAHAYGFALIFRSLPGLWAAAFAQAAILALNAVVERPHYVRMKNGNGNGKANGNGAPRGPVAPREPAVPRGPSA